MAAKKVPITERPWFKKTRVYWKYFSPQAKAKRVRLKTERKQRGDSKKAVASTLKATPLAASAISATAAPPWAKVVATGAGGLLYASGMRLDAAAASQAKSFHKTKGAQEAVDSLHDELNAQTHEYDMISRLNQMIDEKGTETQPTEVIRRSKAFFNLHSMRKQAEAAPGESYHLAKDVSPTFRGMIGAMMSYYNRGSGNAIRDNIEKDLIGKYSIPERNLDLPETDKEARKRKFKPEVQKYLDRVQKHSPVFLNMHTSDYRTARALAFTAAATVFARERPRNYLAKKRQSPQSASKSPRS